MKQGDTFAVFDRRGDAVPYRTSSHGVYHRGTRFLSRLELRIGAKRPVLLGSTVCDGNALLAVDLANPEVDGEARLPADAIHIFRARFVSDAVCYERIRFTNHATQPVELPVLIEVEADYADIFEVRGASRPRRGTRATPEVSEASLSLRYRGLDGVVRATVIRCDPAPHAMSESQIHYLLSLPPKGETTIDLEIACTVGEAPSGSRPAYDQAHARACRRFDALRERGCDVATSSALFDAWVARSVSDLLMLSTETEHGDYPHAGVPWFDALFGRDGIICAREALWYNPSIARGVLRCLAATQARESNDSQDADPGKIVHEMRDGEMAALQEVPFGRYYGSIDATPLFVLLARDYHRRTGDRDTIETLWPAIRDALDWIDVYGDRDGDGFVEYARRTADGLLHQGWKDSNDSVFHDDGRLAPTPIALCEVQGYVYAARRAGAELAALLGDGALAARLRQQAAALRQRFDEHFWCDALGTYALALDGDKQPCRVRSSNAGHCLFTGIARPERAERVMATLMDGATFSGWGIRTIASSEARYNPMSYHNGSIWPHDTAVVAAGMARFGRRDHALSLIEALFQTSLYMDMHRVPELFCGFHRRPGQGPTLYPVACAPQAWAAAAVFLLIEACLGLDVHATARQVRFDRPALPAFLEWMEIRNLTVGDASLDLLLRRARADVSVEVLDKRGHAEVTVIKRV